MQICFSLIKKLSLVFLLALLCPLLKAQPPTETNTRGVKVTAENAGDTIKGDVYAIITGVSNYPGINPLKFADKDALLFRDFLKTPSGGNTKPENILTLINDSAKAADFNVKAYSWLQRKNLKKGDRLYIYFSGHGDAMSEDLYFFLPYDCEPNKDDHNYLGTGNINMYNVKTLFIKPQVNKGVEVLLIMDACRTNELPGGKEGQQNFSKNFIAEQKMGEIMLLSTGAGQVSIESPAIGNGHGLFTYYLVDGLAGAADKDSVFGDNDGRVSLGEISAFVKNTVRQRARTEFNTIQIPAYCCGEKDMATIARVDEPTFIAWENAKKIQQLSADQNLFTVASIRQGTKGGAGMAGADSMQINIYNRFVAALKTEKLMGDASAETYYKQMQEKWPGTDITEDAKFSLAAKFLNFCQQKINLFLSGKGIVHVINMEKKVVKEKSDTANNSFAGMAEDEINKLKTLVNTDYIVAATMMGKAINLLQNEPQLLEPYLPRYDLLKTMAAYANKSNNLKQVLQQCNNYITSDPVSPAGYLLKGWILNDMESDSCKYYFRQAAGIAPKWAYPLNGLGNYYLSQSKYDSALYYFNRTIELDNLNSDAYCNRGLAHFILGGYAGKNGMSIIDGKELDQARKDFVMARNLNPGDCYAKAYFADHQMAFIKSTAVGSVAYNAYYNNAKNNYSASIDCDSNFAMGYQKLADFYEFLGDPAEGLDILKLCTTKNPKNADGFRNLGNYYLQTLNDTTAAVENFQKAITIDPLNSINYFSLARIYRKQKDRTKAIKVYASAIDQIGNNKDLLNEMGNTYFEPPSQFETAIKFYKLALAVDSTLGYTCFNLGKLYALKTDAEDSSIYYYGKAVLNNPYRFRQMIYHVADYYYYAKRYTEAKPFYKLAFNFSSFSRIRDAERLVTILIFENNLNEADSIFKEYLSPEVNKTLYATLTAAIDNARKLKEENITYQVDSLTIDGFIVYDENTTGKRPAVLVVHEWWGLNDYAKKKARELAKLGYIAMAIDMYGNSQRADNPTDAAKLAGPFYQNPAFAKKHVDAALKILKAYPQADTTKIAGIGYCFGGGVLLNIARMGENLNGVVSFHGNLTGTAADKNLLKAKILVLHGEDDKYVTAEEVATFKREMDSIKADYTFKSYPGATHAFTNPDATATGQKFNMPIVYNAAADKASWNEMILFFKEIFK